MLSWQVRHLTAEHAEVHVYNMSSHRLAYALDMEHQLLPLVSGAIRKEMGFSDAAPSNLRSS